MSLRILEERRKFKFHKLKPEDKEEVVKLLSEALRGREEVLVATVFGGFLESELFRDVDVAVFTGYRTPYTMVEAYEEELSRVLESMVGLPVDVVVVDYAPPRFRVKALGGLVLVEREPALSLRLWFKACQEVKDLQAKVCRYG